MKILYLGPNKKHINRFFVSQGDEVTQTEQALSTFEKLDEYDFIISYGYRHIINKEVVTKFYRRAINLHISYLPWNRGADPNLWSFLEDTPKGVTIHYIDEGLDTGDIIIQKTVKYCLEDTLRTSYEKLIIEIENLLMEKWLDIKNGNIMPIPQPKRGTLHKTIDRKKWEHLLTKGWDTPVTDIIGKALERGD
ncbi:formyltransferase family protein [Syntrophomonas erecta]